MQTKKFFVVIGAAVVLAAPLTTVAGPDTDAQAKMREAMRKKMEELNAQSVPAPAPEPVPTPAPAPEAPKPKPAPRTETVVVPVPVEPAPEPVVAKPAPVVEKPAPVVAKPAPIVAKPAPVVAPKVETQAEPVFSEVPDQDAKKNDQLLEAVRAKLEAEKAAKAATAAAAPPAPATPQTPTAPQVAPAPKPVVAVPLTAGMEAPASPLAGTKQERLAELLRRYRADEITPHEYHTQRAKIIAE